MRRNPQAVASSTPPGLAHSRHSFLVRQGAQPSITARRMKEYERGAYTPKVDWKWVGCSPHEYEAIQVDAVARRRLRAEVLAQMETLRDIEAMVVLTERVFDRDGDVLEVTGIIGHMEHLVTSYMSVRNQLSSQAKATSSRMKSRKDLKRTHLGRRLADLRMRIEKLYVSLHGEVCTHLQERCENDFGTNASLGFGSTHGNSCNMSSNYTTSECYSETTCISCSISSFKSAGSGSASIAVSANTGQGPKRGSLAGSAETAMVGAP